MGRKIVMRDSKERVVKRVPWTSKFFKVVPMKDENGDVIKSNVLVPISQYWRKPENEFKDKPKT